MFLADNAWRKSLHPSFVLAFFGGEAVLDDDALNCRSSSSSSAVTASVVGGVEVVVDGRAASGTAGGWDSCELGSFTDFNKVVKVSESGELKVY